jgi:hypothetical protein
MQQKNQSNALQRNAKNSVLADEFFELLSFVFVPGMKAWSKRAKINKDCVTTKQEKIPCPQKMFLCL